MRARPGYASFKTLASGPIRCVAARDGLFDNRALIVADTTAYLLAASGAVTPLGGIVEGDGRVDVAFGQDADLNSVAYTSTEAKLYKVVGDAVTEDATFPEDGASSVAFISGYF